MRCAVSDKENTGHTDPDELPDGSGSQGDANEGEDTASGGGADDR